MLPRNPANPIPTPAVERAIVAHVAAALRGPGDDNAEAAASARWPRDETTPIVIRATSSPATLGSHAAVAATAVSDFLGSLPSSAGSKLFRSATTIDMGRLSRLLVPVDASATDTGLAWVGEGAPIPVVDGTADVIELVPRKLGTMVVLAENVARVSGAEAFVRGMFARRTANALDAALFSTSAASDDASAGLLHGVAPIAGYAGGDDLAIREDLKALAGALADAGGSGQVLIVAHPTSAAVIALAFPNLAWPVVPSRAIPAGRIIAVDPSGVVFGVGPTINIETVSAGLVHMASPAAEIVTDAGTVADPVRELYQTNSLATRLLLSLAFGARAGSVAYIDGASW